MKYFGTFLGANILLLLGKATGYLCLIIPGIYLSVRWSFVNIIIADQGVGVREAFKQSSDIVKGCWWHVFALELISSIISFILGTTWIGVLILPAVCSLLTIAYYKELRES